MVWVHRGNNVQFPEDFNVLKCDELNTFNSIRQERWIPIFLSSGEHVERVGDRSVADGMYCHWEAVVMSDGNDRRQLH